MRLLINKALSFFGMREPTAALLLFCAVAFFFAFFICAFQFDGPAYLSDEIGYLSKAAAIAGYSIDHPSSWHAGYSILIAPAFYFFDDYDGVWKGVQAINSLMFACAFVVLYHALRRLHSEVSAWSVLVATVVATCYPAWLVGLVTPGAPAGVGVREMVLLFLLNGQVGPEVLLLAVVLGRLLTVAGDFLFFAAMVTTPKLRKSLE